MKTRIPNELAGASLLGVHNWIKKQVALSNPGGSPDYKLSDMSGNRITLSDIARNPGKEVMIEVATIEGVRTNPSLRGLAPIPGYDLNQKYITPNSGSLTELIGDDFDHVLVERIVAEQGLRRGLHSLNRLLLQRHDMRVSSPTTAAILQMGEIIKSNPSDRTPFTQRTPIIYSPERALAHWIAENEGTGNVDANKLTEEQLVDVYNHKISSKYGLNSQDISKFANDVLADFLFAASANRGLVRLIISQNVDNIRTDRQTIHKLIQLFPQQPDAFYNGSQRVFVAHPAFIYPALAESALTQKQMEEIVKFAKGYPANMGRYENVPVKIKAMINGKYELLRESDSLTDNAIKWAQLNTVDKAKQLFNRWRQGRTGVEAHDSDRELESQFSRKAPMQVIFENLTRDPRASLRKKGFKPLYYFSDIGGFYPTPPPRWPKQLMLAIMDAFLENLPYIINADDPTQINISPARLAYFSEPTKEIEVELDNKKETYTAEEIVNFTKDYYELGWSATPTAYTELYKKHAKGKHLKLAEGKSVKDVREMATELASQTTLSSSDAAERTSTLSFDASAPKSILEMAYDVATIANSKYGYNMRGDDFKFVMTILHYSMRTLARPPTRADVRLDSAYVMDAFRDFLGANKYEELQALQQQLIDGSADQSVLTGFTQTSVLADLINFRDEMTQTLNRIYDDPDQGTAAVKKIIEEYTQIREQFMDTPMSLGMNQAVVEIFQELNELETQAKGVLD
jgi:hypothetical protein